jgi:tight adherence protein C
MALLRLGCLVLFALGVFGLGLWLSRVPVPPAPRLGRRGSERRRALEAGGIFAAAEPGVRFVAGLVALLPLGRLRARQELELRRADSPLGLLPDEYSALSILSAVVLGSAGAGIAGVVDTSAVVLALPAAAFGLILPALQVQEIIRTRVKEISRGLPHAIEIAAMCMGAGLDFPGALRLVAEPGAPRKSALGRELTAILEELELGHTRKEALLAFAERVPTDAVRDFVNAVIQAETKGNPLARVIQIQGRMLSQRRSVAAEEAAARAGVLLIGPMVLLVGCILLLLMGPLLSKGVGF